jgi:hypothetical protein
MDKTPTGREGGDNAAWIGGDADERLPDSHRFNDDRTGYGASIDSREQFTEEELSGIRDIPSGDADERMGNSIPKRLQGHSGNEFDGNKPGRDGTIQNRSTPAASCGGWSIIPCGDGKARRIKSGLMPLVNGLPGRVGLIRGYGNAIIPTLAAEFIRAYMETSCPNPNK